MALEHVRPDTATIIGTRAGQNGEEVQVWEGNKDDDWEWANSQNVDYARVDDSYNQATNIFDNKAEKIGKNPLIDLDNVGYGYKFKNVMDLWKNNAEVQAHRDNLLAEGRDYYNSKVGQLPKVCDHKDGCSHFCDNRDNAEFPTDGLDDTNCLQECQANSAACASTCAVNGSNSDACTQCLGVGQHCRATHKELLIGAIREKWWDINKSVQSELEAIVTLTHQKFAAALIEAEACEHGCQCQFIAGEYHRLKNKIAGWNSNIVDREAKIAGAQAELEEIDQEPCDFSSLIEPFEKRWEVMAEEWQGKIAVYEAADYWKTDSWNMDQAVNQEKFKDLYNFDYDAQKFDNFIEE